MNASYDPEKHRRRSIRLRHHDYSRAGAYYITVCTDGRKLLFGEVIDDEVKLNESGRIAAEEWSKSAQVRSELELDTWVVMPNHVHGVVMITDRGRGDRPVAPTGGLRSRSLGALIAGFKSAATRRINAMRGTPGASVWQRNYYEHVIRDESALHRVRQYIADNPARWSEDPENPAVSRGDRLVAPTSAGSDNDHGPQTLSWLQTLRCRMAGEGARPLGGAEAGSVWLVLKGQRWQQGR